MTLSEKSKIDIGPKNSHYGKVILARVPDSSQASVNARVTGGRMTAAADGPRGSSHQNIDSIEQEGATRKDAHDDRSDLSRS